MQHSSIRTVFISRRLAPESVFRQELTGENVVIIDQSLLTLTPVNFAAFPTTDWLFFYSKNGVDCFFQQLTTLGFAVRQQKIGVIGEGTAKALEKWGYAPHFVGNGLPPDVAAAFASEAQGKSVLFVSAAHSKNSIEEALSSTNIRTYQLIVYENTAHATDTLPDDLLILVFTSPLNVAAYFKNHQVVDYQHFVAIGESTTAALRAAGVSYVHVAPTPSEAALAAIVKTILAKAV